LFALGASEFLAWDGDELRAALKKADQVIQHFCPDVARPLRHHGDETIFDVLLISFNFVDDLCWVLLLNFGRPSEQILNVVENCTFKELGPSLATCFFLHRVTQFLE